MAREAEFFKEAQRQLTLADHLLTMTYPLVKDSKLLVGIMQNISQANNNIITGVLYMASKSQQIIPTTTFATRFSQCKTFLKPFNIIPKEDFEVFQAVHDLEEEHKKSPVTFSRDQKYVLCGDDYTLTTLTEKNLKSFLQQAKKILVTLQEWRTVS